jgi:hypothetical protein
MEHAERESQNLVFAAAQPIEPGEKIKAQKKRAFKVLRLHQVEAGQSMLDNAWAGRAGAPTYARLLEQAVRVGLVKVVYASERMPRTDPDFMDHQVVGMTWKGGE